MTTLGLLLALGTLAKAQAGMAVPEFLTPLAFQEARAEEEPRPVAPPPMIAAKVRVAAPDVQKALDESQAPILALGAKSIQAIGNARTAFLFRPAPPAEMKEKIKQALAELAKLGVVHGYHEEYLPPLEMRTAQMSVYLEGLKDERKRLAKALAKSPKAAKAIDDEIVRLSTLKAEDEPRQVVLTVFFDQEASGVAPGPEIKNFEKEIREGDDRHSPVVPEKSR